MGHLTFDNEEKTGRVTHDETLCRSSGFVPDSWRRATIRPSTRPPFRHRPRPEVHATIDTDPQYGYGRRPDHSISAAQDHRQHLLCRHQNAELLSCRDATGKYPDRQHLRTKCANDREVRSATRV